MPWPQDAYVGQEVVCVNNQNKYRPLLARILKEGSIYTISRLSFFNNGDLALTLNNVFDPLEFEGVAPRYRYWRFRPIQSTETGMSILRGLLVPNKEFVDA